MKELKIGEKVVKLYDNIDELPIANYNLMNEYSLLDYEIGSTLQDVEKRFQRLDAFLAASKLPEAIQERKNLQQTFWNALNRVNFPALQFGCFLHSIDGERVADYSRENIEKLIEVLSNEGLTQGAVKKETDDIKKKSGNN